MQLSQKYRIPLIIGGVAVAIAAIGWLGYVIYDNTRPVPDIATFRTSFYSFDYPREYRIEEYASGVISVGTETEEGFQPLVEVVRYQNDPQAPQPASYAQFVNRQLVNLCGSDDPSQPDTCESAVGEAYQSPTGFQGQQFNLELTSSTAAAGAPVVPFGPIYVFNITRDEQEPPIRYSALVVYPSLDAVKKGLDTATIQSIVMQTFDLTPDRGGSE
ncbi:MAG TPA: hypothetical protein VNU25_00080 [Candidatus Paceibacterota bacterium]|nr:hypothetical protein [Candidatus Paceibacterota bacterium]